MKLDYFFTIKIWIMKTIAAKIVQLAKKSKSKLGLHLNIGLDHRLGAVGFYYPPPMRIEPPGSMGLLGQVHTCFIHGYNCTADATL